MATPIPPDDIRTAFSREMSRMYRAEVPAYGTLVDLVHEVNDAVLEHAPEDRRRLAELGELDRISDERHGAIRLGTAAELAFMRRVFAVMGMFPVGYYDLGVAGVPVHSTAFRPVDDAALRRNPFRVFTSLLRLELIEDADLRAEAAAILSRRRIFTPRCVALVETAEADGGLDRPAAEAFVHEALKTFRWHATANVSHALYRRLHGAHRLIADVVGFRGPHINHLTPRTLDIDAVQRRMPDRGIAPKAVVEGPPPRAVPLLLRQTSFKALEEPVSFGDGDTAVAGRHTARFGEIEQRGLALTPAGQALYDRLLAETRSEIVPAADGSNADAYRQALAVAFTDFPDDSNEIHRRGLGYFRYSATGRQAGDGMAGRPAGDLVAACVLRADPIVYEDFLPVSAAGIFQSNLGDGGAQAYEAAPGRDRFEADLGAPVIDLHDLYAAAEARSLSAARDALRRSPAL